jgi:hypothetical protein
VAERPPAGRPGPAPRAAGPLWFLADRDAFLRRFVLRTLLEPPRSARGLARRRPGR